MGLLSGPSVFLIRDRPGLSVGSRLGLEANEEANQGYSHQERKGQTCDEHGAEEPVLELKVHVEHDYNGELDRRQDDQQRNLGSAQVILNPNPIPNQQKLYDCDNEQDNRNQHVLHE